MTTKAELIAARRGGLAAPLGTTNPYDGNTTPVLAQMWRAGYRQMLADRLATSPARQAYLQRMLRHAKRGMTLDVYSDLFDTDLDALGDTLNHVGTGQSVGRMWARGADPAV